MKYGEILVTQFRFYEKLQFAYRIDPVPFTGERLRRRSFYFYYKRPRTTQERRMFDPQYSRTKRNLRYLPNAYDDFPRGDVHNRRSWKERYKIKKQWMKHTK